MANAGQDPGDTKTEIALDTLSNGLIDTADKSLRKTAAAVFGTYFELMAYKFAKYGQAQASLAEHKILSESQTRKITEKLKGIDPDDAVAAPTEIVGPIIDQLAYTQDENINDILIGLLISAGSKKRKHLVHPSLILVAKSLSSDEAFILKGLANRGLRTGIAVISIESVDPRPEMRGERASREKYYSYINKLDGLSYPENTDMYMQNMASLGLFINKAGFFPEKKENGTKNVPMSEYKRLSDLIEGEYEPHNEHATIVTTNAMFVLTPLGNMLLDTFEKITI